MPRTANPPPVLPGGRRGGTALAQNRDRGTCRAGIAGEVAVTGGTAPPAADPARRGSAGIAPGRRGGGRCPALPAGTGARPAGGHPRPVCRDARPGPLPGHRPAARNRPRDRCPGRSAKPRVLPGWPGAPSPPRTPGRSPRPGRRRARPAPCLRQRRARSAHGHRPSGSAQDREEIVELVTAAAAAMAATAGYLATGAAGLAACRFRHAERSLDIAAEQLRQALACARAGHARPAPFPRRSSPDCPARREDERGGPSGSLWFSGGTGHADSAASISPFKAAGTCG